MKVKIHCFEGEWDRRHPELRVEPLIKLLKQLYVSSGNHLTYSYKFCQSIARLKKELPLDGRGLSSKSFQHCLYFAFHGNSQGLWGDADDTSISFEEIADTLGHKAAGSVIFFGSCGTRASENSLHSLKIATNAKLVVGYTSNVDWLLSSMFEMYFFSELCRYKNFGSFVKRMQQVAGQEIFSELKIRLV